MQSESGAAGEASLPRSRAARVRIRGGSVLEVELDTGGHHHILVICFTWLAHSGDPRVSARARRPCSTHRADAACAGSASCTRYVPCRALARARYRRFKTAFRAGRTRSPSSPPPVGRSEPNPRRQPRASLVRGEACVDSPTRDRVGLRAAGETSRRRRGRSAKSQRVVRGASLERGSARICTDARPAPPGPFFFLLGLPGCVFPASMARQTSSRISRELCYRRHRRFP